MKINHSDKKYIFSILFGVLCALQFLSLTAQTDRGYYTAPYIRYEAEDGIKSSDAILYSSPQIKSTETAAEASGLKYIALAKIGDFVKFAVKNIADGITLRFNMPDTADGLGRHGSLNVYVNGVQVKTLNLTSYWAYQYFYNTNPSNSPSARPHMRFDEIHFKLTNKAQVGDTIMIQKDIADNMEYGIDFIEIEEVPAKIEKPAGYYSVTDYPAISDILSFTNCIAAAIKDGKNVYIPEGKFVLDARLQISAKNLKILGAGIWYTEVNFSNNEPSVGGISASKTTSNVEISNFYMSTINNERLYADIVGQYKDCPAFSGVYGTGSKIHNIWLDHFETGFWIGDYSKPVVSTNGLSISECRIRNTYADGVNFTQGTSNSVVEYSSIRNCGDDGLAIWPNNSNSAPMTKNNIFRYCTVEHVWRASGIAIFGGEGHLVYNCLVKDSYESSGIRFTTDFSGYPFSTNASIPILLSNNTLINCGTSADLWAASRGAIEFNATTNGKDICNIHFVETTIIDAQQRGIQFSGSGGKFYNITFYNTIINGTGHNGSTQAEGIWSSATATQSQFDYVIFENLASVESYNANATFKLIINNKGQLGIENISSKEEFKMFYNPVGDIIHIQGDIICLINIYDLSGRKLFEKENISKQSDFSVNTNWLKRGIYLIQVETQSHGIISGKIIK